jgi:hypothetical protein
MMQLGQVKSHASPGPVVSYKNMTKQVMLDVPSDIMSDDKVLLFKNWFALGLGFWVQILAHSGRGKWREYLVPRYSDLRGLGFYGHY